MAHLKGEGFRPYLQTMKQIVECVANFSEGKRIEVVDAIVTSIGSVHKVLVLGRESDSDHNRSVITFAGPPEAIVEAAFQGIKKAAELIDLDIHKGEHPRIGATDVVPFIPIEGVTMQDCVKLAGELGKRVGSELNIPVYLYEAAATRPERENLANIRKGQYEGLKEAIKTDPDRKPDFGPNELSKSGATVIGARAPLVAYNIYLNTTDIDIAKKIGKTIRHSGGGLRFVKALGMEVEGLAQVSMNLTNFTKTPVHLVVDTVRDLATHYGTTIKKSELVGLIPRQALIDAAQWYLNLDDFSTGQILENSLEEAQKTTEEVEDRASFLRSLADKSPTPGGGSAAAYGGAMGAALVAMVARSTIGKKKYAGVESQMQEIVEEAEKMRAELEKAVQRDADAFEGVMAAYKMPKNTEAEEVLRAQQIERALRHAAEVPLVTAYLAFNVVDLAVEVAEIGNINAITDAAAAAALAQTAVYAAGLNVKINANQVNDREVVKEWMEALADFDQKIAHYQERIQIALRERGKIEV